MLRHIERLRGRLKTMLYTKENLPDGFNHYRKTHITQAVRIDGPFRVKTIDGAFVFCDDGWLALDSRGYPYPINNVVFEESFEEIGG